MARAGARQAGIAGALLGYGAAKATNRAARRRQEKTSGQGRQGRTVVKWVLLAFAGLWLLQIFLGLVGSVV